MKILTVIGARPQFVKAAAVSVAIRDHGELDEVLLHTGQHYDPEMSAIFFEQLSLPRPDYSLDVGSGSHGWQTAAMLSGIEPVLERERPDLVMVYGDTNSTIAGALAATKLHIPVAHVEAGLRSFNRKMPEEINRVLTDHASDLLFAPTDTAVRNLYREGIRDDHVFLVGDVMLDAVRLMQDLMQPRSPIAATTVSDSDFALLTLHRAENTDNPERLEAIVNQLAELNVRMQVIFPIHPRTRGALQKHGLLDRCERLLKCIPPVGYLQMLELERDATLILTDSGGVQKEAFFWKRPCITLRDETEWTELVDMGWNRLYSVASGEPLVNTVAESLEASRTDASPYGDGRAAFGITQEIFNWLSQYSRAS